MQESLPNRPQRQMPISIPERELLGFVSAVSELFGSGQGTFLREIWLDELASMDAMPAPTSSEWRLVTLAAWARLANHVADAPGIVAVERSATTAQAGSFRATDTKV